MKGSNITQSPNLRSHLRSRPVHYLTREEEEKEAEEMKAMQVKANALNPKIFEPPALGVRVERKPPTVPVPFKLTEIAKKKSTAPPVFVFTAKPVPKAVLDAPQGIPKKKELPLTVPVSPACLKKSKVYAMSLDLEDEARKLQEAAQFKARPADVIHKKPFEPKKSERPLMDITTVELNTERRAKEREEFDTMIKAEHAKQEELRRLRDETLKREEIYVCMYIRMYAYMYVCMYVCTYLCIYVCTYVCCMYVRMCVCIYVYMYYVCMHICMYLCMYVHMYVSMYVYMYVHTYVCMYVHMYVCMYVCTYVCMYVCTYVCMYVHMYVCMYVCMYVHKTSTQQNTSGMVV